MVVIPPNVASRHLLTPARPSSSSQEAISNAMHKTPKPGIAPRALAGAQPPAQTPSPAPFIGLSPPTSPRRRAENQTANPTSPRRRHRRDSLGVATDDEGRTPSGAIATHKPRRGVAASLNDLVHWRQPSRTAKVAGGGFYLMLCVGSLRTVPLPAGTVACYAFIFALAASLFTRLFQRVRRNLGFGMGIGGMDAAAMESASDQTRKKREARVRLMAAKFGGWVAASAAARAPVAAETWIAAEAIVRWDRPVTTLRACFLLWFASAAARVWRLSAGYTVALLWCALFTVPPFVAALGPAAGDAAVRVVTWYAGKWVNDRRVQLAIVGFVWSATGYAGRTMLTMTLVIAFLAGAGSNGDRHGNGRPRGSRERERGGVTVEDEAMDGEGRAAKGGERREGVTVAGGVTIEEMPPSPAAAAPLGRVDPNVSAVSSSRGGGAKQRTPVAAASFGRDDSAKESRGGSLSASDEDSALALGSDSGLARGAERDSPAKRTPPFVGGGEKDWSGGGSVSAARRRMIADRARRILEGDESD